MSRVLKRTVFAPILILIWACLAQALQIPASQEGKSGDIRIIHADLPLYPVLANAARIEGAVNVRVVVEIGEVSALHEL